MALQTAMEGRARQMRDGRLQGVEAVVERQQGMPSESDDHRLFFLVRTVDLGFFGPVGRSATEVRPFHLATVF
jgi:hypothetical protein